jgi:hypothetical protein
MAEVIDKQHTNGTSDHMFSNDDRTNNSVKKKQKITPEETEVFDADALHNSSLTWNQAGAYFNVISMLAQQDRVNPTIERNQKYLNIREILKTSIDLIDIKLSAQNSPDDESEESIESIESDRSVAHLGEYTNFDVGDETEEE